MADVTERIYGALAGAAVGEAMATATATWTPEQIVEANGGYVTTLTRPAPSTRCKGLLEPGQVSDGFSFTYLMVHSTIEHGGLILPEEAEETLLKWWDDPRYRPLAGISSALAYERLGQRSGEGYRYPYLTFDHHKATIEAAARAAAVAVFFPGDPDMAVEQVVSAYRTVFDNTVGLSGAGAAAAAISAALSGEATFYDVLSAAVYGARRGLETAESYRVQPAACASVERRIQMAVEIGLRYRGRFDLALRELDQCIGTGSFANESVATAIGCVAACGGDARESIKMAVNIGNETEPMANVVGAIVGALHPEALDPRDITLVERVNGFDLQAVSERIAILNRENAHYYI